MNRNAPKSSPKLTKDSSRKVGMSRALFELDPNSFNIHGKEVSLVLFGTKHRKLGESKFGSHLEKYKATATPVHRSNQRQ